MAITQNYLPQTKELSEQELAVLGMAAYIGNYPSSSQIIKVQKKVHVLEHCNPDAIAKHALELGVLRRHNTYSWDKNYDITPFYHFPLVFHILSFHGNWGLAYETSKLAQTALSSYIWELAKAINDNDSSKILFLREKRRWPYWTANFGYCEALFYVHDFRDVILTLPQNDFLQLVRRKICERRDYDEPFDDSQYFEALVTDYARVNNYGSLDETMDEIAAYKFFYDGKEPVWKHRATTSWSAAICAIQSMYRRNLSEADVYFKKAMELHNYSASDKNLFYTPEINFYLMLFYAMTGKPVYRNKADLFIRKPFILNNNDHFPANCIARYVVLEHPSEGHAREVTNYILQSDKTNHSFIMASIIAHFLDYSAKDINVAEDCFEPDILWALPGYELSAFTGKTDNALSERLGGGPIIAEFKRKSGWEAAVSDILNFDNKDANGKDKRLIYEILGDGHITIREQKLTKRGSWSSGTMLMPYSISLTRDSLEEEDKQIISVLHGNYGTRAENILPYLIGSDRVFYCGRDKYSPVTVSEEKMYVCIDRTSKGYKVSSNLKTIPIKDGHVVQKDSDTHYTVFKLNRNEAFFMGKLLAIGSFPSEAGPVLKQVAEKFCGKVEIHTDLIDDNSSLEKAKADCRIIIQVQPAKDAFQVKTGVRPLENGKLFIVPGQGSARVYDTGEDGKRYQLERDIKREQASMDEFLSCIPAVSDEIDNYGEIPYLCAEDLLEILDFVQDRQDCFAVEWPQGHGFKFKGKATTKAIKASLVSKEKWFEIEGELTIDKDTVISLSELLQLFSQSNGHRFIKLSDGDYISLSDNIRQTLKKLETASTSKGTVPFYQVGALAELVNTDDSFIKADKKFKTLEQKVEKAATMKIDVPDMLQAELRPYQREGFEWMMRLFEWGAGACLADDMGLGKTVQAITAILSRKGPALIIAPASVVMNWASEISRFAPSLKCSILNESNERELLINNVSDNEAVICSYGLLVRTVEALSAKKWSTIVLDEAHTIKNRDTKMSAAAMQLRAGARIALTGTPIQNNLSELWNIFQFINPGLLDSFDKFSERYISGQFAQQNVKRLKNVIRPFVLRRKKSDVIEELPDKTEIFRKVELSDLETAAYEAFRARASQELETSEKIDINALAEITRLREAACSISLVKKGWSGNESKIEAAIDIIRNVIDSGNRILVFSQFTSFLSKVRDRLGHEESFYLDGTTPIKKRSLMVQDFQNGINKVFFISLKAGGLGLNLTGANYVLHLDPWWNPAIEQQATDRAYRIGQNQNVTVYHLISANTIEEKILRLHKVKRDIADSLLSGTAVASAITLVELRELVRPATSL